MTEKGFLKEERDCNRISPLCVCMSSLLSLSFFSVLYIFNIRKILIRDAGNKSTFVTKMNIFLQTFGKSSTPQLTVNLFSILKSR